MVFPVVIGNKGFESQLRRAQKFLLAGDGIQPEQTENRLPVIVDNAESVFDGKIGAVQHMHEGSVPGILHMQDAASHGLHQWNIFLPVDQFRVFREQQQSHAAAAQFDFPAFDILKKDGFLSVRQARRSVRWPRVEPGRPEGRKLPAWNTSC